MMLCAAYISFLFLAIQLFNASINFLFQQKLKNKSERNKNIISVLIPARNEEENIGFLLSDLQKIQTSNIEILVFDDQSIDDTTRIITDFSEYDKRIRLIKSDGLPNGWSGKNHACYQLAQKAKGNLYLFIDADVRINGNVINDAVWFLKDKGLGLLSIFPVQIQKSLGEKLSVPIMNYILLTLLPLIFVRISPYKSHSAANGQFMLFNAEIYNRFQPHKLFKNSVVEDISISQFLKKQKIKIACLTGEKRIKCRMYKSYKESLSGFTKNILMFFGNMPVFAFLFWLFAAFGFVPVLFAAKELLFIYFFGVLFIQFLYASTCKQQMFPCILLFPFQLVFILQVTINAIFMKTQKKYLWKERNIFST